MLQGIMHSLVHMLKCGNAVVILDCLLTMARLASSKHLAMAMMESLTMDALVAAAASEEAGTTTSAWRY